MLEGTSKRTTYRIQLDIVEQKVRYVQPHRIRITAPSKELNVSFLNRQDTQLSLFQGSGLRGASSHM